MMAVPLGMLRLAWDQAGFGADMQQAMDFVLAIGRFAGLVIVVCVAVMLFISFVERDKRPGNPPDNKNRKG